MDKYIKVNEKIKYIKFEDILKNKTENYNIKDIINCLNKNNILIIGLYDYVNSNYESINKILKDLEENNFNESYTNLLFKIYNLNNDISIKNEIINLNIGLVPYMINYLNLNKYKERDDLLSIGYEALMKSIDNFDISRNIEFSTYACTCIKGYIITFINSQYNLPKSVINKFVKEKKIYNEEVKDYQDNLEYYQSILNKVNSNVKNKYWSNERNIRLNIAFPDNIEDIDEKYCIEYNMDKNIDYKILKQKLDDFLSILSVKKEMYIRLLYNIDNRNLTFKDIQKIYNIKETTLRYNSISFDIYKDTKEYLDLLEVTYPELFEKNFIIKK